MLISVACLAATLPSLSFATDAVTLSDSITFCVICVQDPFIVKSRPLTILRDLVERTKVAAREHDNAVARRFERMMNAVAESETDLSESTLSLNVTDSLTVVIYSFIHCIGCMDMYNARENQLSFSSVV
jgi:hypothetical protein